MKIHLVKTIYSDETFYVKELENKNFYKRIGNNKNYPAHILIFIRNVD